MGADAAALASARPGFAVAGTDQPRLDAALIRVVVSDSIDGVAHCEAEFSNWGDNQGTTGFTWFDRGVLEFGKDFVVRIGSATVFDGRIMALEGRFPESAPPTLLVRAEDRLQDLRMTRRTRAFDRVSDSDVVQQIASDHGLQADVEPVGIRPTPSWRRSTRATWRSCASARCAVDAEVWLEGKTLHAASRASRRDAQLELVHGARLRQFSVCADLAHQRTAVVCGGWDVVGQGGGRGGGDGERDLVRSERRHQRTRPAAAGARRAQGYGRAQPCRSTAAPAAPWPRRTCARWRGASCAGAAWPMPTRACTSANGSR